MPSGPDLFDDGDGLEPDQPSRTTKTGATRSSPNYLIRRGVAVGGVVAVLAAASIVIGQLMASDDTDSTSGAIGAEWNRIVLVDDRTGRIVVADADGDELSRIGSGVRTPSASAVVDSSLMVADDELVAVVDLDAETVDEYEFGVDAIVNPSGSALTMVAPRPDGGRAVLVHGPSGEAIDTDSFAPVVGARFDFVESRSSTSGRDVLVTDAGNFQSVLFSFDRDEPSYFVGLALAVDADLVVTAQNVGNEATISVFDHDREPVATGRTPSVRAGMISDGGVVLVTVEGEILVMSTSDGDVSEAGSVDIGTVESGDVTTTGDRLVVTGASGTAIIDADAAVVATLEEQQPTGDDRSPGGSTCITTTGAVGEDGARIAVIDVATGDLVVEAVASEPVFSDATGCVVGVLTTAGFDLLDAGGVERFRNDDTLLAVAPDGIEVAVERNGRVVVLDHDIPAGDDEQEPIDLGPRGRTVHFARS